MGNCPTRTIVWGIVVRSSCPGGICWGGGGGRKGSFPRATVRGGIVLELDGAKEKNASSHHIVSKAFFPD